MNINVTKAFAAATIILAAAPATAEDFNTQIVSYEDLDLSKKEGLLVLNKRLDRAIGRVCYIPDSRSIAQTRQAGKCRRQLRSELDDLVEDLAKGRVAGTRVIMFKADKRQPA